MKKLIFFIVFIFFLGLTVFIVPTKPYTSIGKTVIEGNVEEVYKKLSDVQEWSYWSSWIKDDSGSNRSIESSESTNARNSWIQWQNSSLSGELVIMDLIPNEAIRYKLQLNKPFSSSGDVFIKLKPQDNNLVELSWDAKLTPLNLFSKVQFLLEDMKSLLNFENLFRGLSTSETSKM